VTEPSEFTVTVRVVRFLHACVSDCTLRIADDVPRPPLPTPASASPVSIGSNAASVLDCAASLGLSEGALDEGCVFAGTAGAGDVPPPPPHPASSAAATNAASRDERIDDLLSKRVRWTERTSGARALHWTVLRSG
jgi:hypothetical protein